MRPHRVNVGGRAVSFLGIHKSDLVCGASSVGRNIIGILIELTARRQLSCMTVCTCTSYYYRHSQVTMYRQVIRLAYLPPPRPSHVLIVSKWWSPLPLIGPTFLLLGTSIQSTVFISGRQNLVTLKVHKIEIFFGFDFEICIISLLVMSKYKD